MTLLANEIHVQDSLQHTVIIFAADRRITFLGRFHSLGKKIFPIEYLNAGIGFFGLAEVFPGGKKQSMSSWLPQFITRNHRIRTLEEFADTLRAELDNVVPRDLKTSNPSGFHIAGFNQSGLPEFWFVRNIEHMDAHRYIDLQDHYSATEDFLARDARQFGFDGHSPTVARPFTWFYRNGDIRAHVVAWERLDGIIADFLSLPDFKKLNSLCDYERFIEFKMKMIAAIYKEYSTAATIGTPIDVFSIVPK
ncbi:MAG: hypothetical protein FJ217_04735 [Ignavibacteria bacterium]|nr:hypothetical protein [Ignavibacteria bacterium]